MTDIRPILQGAIARVLGELGVIAKDIHLEHPEVAEQGDYSTNVALRFAKETGKKPREFAEEIAEQLRKGGGSTIEKIEVAGPGFINFRLSREFFSDAIGEILEEGDDYGKNKARAGKKIIIEYTNPNLFKEFHIGHLMSNTIGESLSRLLEFSGAKVKRANNQGDIGLHVAKALWGLRLKGVAPDGIVVLGQAYVLGSEAYETDADAKKEIDAVNKKIYERDNAELAALYEKGRRASLEYLETIYEKLGTHFDYYFFESESGPLGKLVVEENTGKVFEKSDGATIFRGEKYGLHTRVFVTSNDVPTYESKELGLAKLKHEKYPYDISFVVTGNEQIEYFRVVRKAMELVSPELAQKTIHVPHGMLRLPSGKMSSRTGGIITAEWLIEEAKKRILEKMKDADVPNKETVAEEVAIGAIKYSILRHATGSDIIFDFDASLSFEGDSGPYLQYTHARILSVLAKAELRGTARNGGGTEAEITGIEKLLYRFPEVVFRADAERAPQFVATYLTEIAQAFNNFYAHERIADSPYRLALAEATATVLKNGLWILGIKAPEKM